MRIEDVRIMLKIQQDLEAPKNQYSEFGDYHYRSLEDIFTGLKPLLFEHDAYLNIQEDVIVIEGARHVKAEATLYIGESKFNTVGYARIPDSKPKLDDSQVSGSASSYARKYALNSLFLIDDSRDPDSMDNSGPNGGAAPQAPSKSDDKPWYNSFDGDKEAMLNKVRSGERTPDQIIQNLSKNFKINKKVRDEIKGMK